MHWLSGMCQTEKLNVVDAAMRHYDAVRDFERTEGRDHKADRELARAQRELNTACRKYRSALRKVKAASRP